MNITSSPLTKYNQPVRTGLLFYEMIFWCYAWLGIALAGGCFGFFLGFMGSGVQGLAFGFFFSGIAAFPVLVTVAVATWALWLSRFRLIAAAIAGAMALFASVKFVEMPGLEFKDFTWIFGRLNGLEIAAMVSGAGGSSLFGFLFCRGLTPDGKKGVDSPKPWQFSLRDLFVHFTILALLISLWTWLFTSVRDAEKRNGQTPSATVNKITSPPQLPVN